MSKSLIFAGLLCGAMLAYGGATVFAAETDPTVDQIYQATRSGHLEEAEQMINQVLRDRPESSRAHYVAAEVYARAGNYARARSELASAEQLSPGLPRENPNSVAELRSELSSSRVPQAFSPVVRPHEGRERSGLPWGWIILIAAAIGVIWLIARRRAQMYQGYPGGYPGNVPPPVPGQPGYGPGAGPGPYYPGYPGGGGGGSGLMSSLGTGLAVGAGVAAGEELVHHVLDGNHPSGGVISSASADELESAPPANSDMGGQDFGVNDPGSWDDSSGGGDDGGGGDDWT